MKKIAVLRANAIGDYIFALPALEALRYAYGDAEIVYLGQDWHAGFLGNRPGPIDRVIPIPYSKGVRDDGRGEGQAPGALEAFFEKMVQEKFDLAIQIHGGGRYSNPFVKRLRARVSAGLRTPDAIPLDRWLPYVYYQTEIFRYLEVVGLVGAQPITLQPRLAVTEYDMAESWRQVPVTDKPLVVLHPGAGDTRRRWPPEKFAAIGDALAAEGAHVMVTGTRPEREVAAAILDAMTAEAQNLCEGLSLGGLLGLLSRCAVVVSNDSGPMHLALAVGRPTVGIYWCGNLINADPLWRRNHRPHLSWRLDCPVCGLNCIDSECEHRASFVADVAVADVLRSARELMALSRERPRSILVS